jgi:truncated hemoglobin YjbI
MNVSTQESLYLRLGGQPAVTAVVDALYRAVLGDERLRGYFAAVDIDQLKDHMAALLSQVLGGPAGYTGRDLHVAHLGLGITAEHYDLVGAYLVGILAARGADDEVLEAVRGVLASVAGDIVE